MSTETVDLHVLRRSDGSLSVYYEKDNAHYVIFDSLDIVAELAAKDAELDALGQERDEATEELTRRREEFETMLQRLIATEAERDALRAVDGKK